MARNITRIINPDPLNPLNLLVNLLPLVGVLFYGWSPERIFTVYCLETIIIGFFTVVKMFIVGQVQTNHLWNDTGPGRTTMSTTGFILFFIAHYGLFVTVQTGIFFSMVDIGDISPFSGYRELFAYLNNREILIMLGAFTASYAVTDLGQFVVSKDYREEPMMLVMFSPYGRIIIQQFVVILGGFFLQFFPGAIFISLFIVVKLYVENYIGFDRRLREQFYQRLKK